MDREESSGICKLLASLSRLGWLVPSSVASPEMTLGIAQNLEVTYQAMSILWVEEAHNYFQP